MTRINKKAEQEMAERFEEALDKIGHLDKVPFYIKAEAAKAAAYTAMQYLLLPAGR